MGFEVVADRLSEVYVHRMENMLRKILVTPRSLTIAGHPSLERLRKAGYELVFSSPGVQPDEQELMRLLPGCVGMLAGIELITARVLRAADSLRVISRNGVGISNIDVEAARRLGIRILVAAGANTEGVAELVFGLALSMVRSIPFSNASLKGRRWERQMGCELEGKVLGLIGCGRIGKRVAGIALAFGMRVLAFDPVPDQMFARSEMFEYVPLERLLRTADLISLHCPPQADGKPLIDRNRIQIMKKGVYLINTARAELVNEDDILEGLDASQIAGFATDVFAPEPPSNWRLATHPKVVCTPHIGAFTRESIDRAVDMAVNNLLSALGSMHGGT